MLPSHIYFQLVFWEFEHLNITSIHISTSELCYKIILRSFSFWRIIIYQNDMNITVRMHIYFPCIYGNQFSSQYYCKGMWIQDFSTQATSYFFPECKRIHTLERNHLSFDSRLLKALLPLIFTLIIFFLSLKKNPNPNLHMVKMKTLK